MGGAVSEESVESRSSDLHASVGWVNALRGRSYCELRFYNKVPTVAKGNWGVAVGSLPSAIGVALLDCCVEFEADSPKPIVDSPQFTQSNRAVLLFRRWRVS